MKEQNASTSRRHFLKTTLTVPVAFATVPGIVSRAVAADDKPATPATTTTPATAVVPAAGPLPMRKLGRTDRQVTMLNLGGMERALSPDYLDIAWTSGIRYFDTADCYLGGRSEKIVGEWLAKYPGRRQELFLVSKDHPHQGPQQLLEMIDRRLAACGAKYLDAFYIHGLGTREYGDASLEWPKSDEFKKVCEQLKESGKVKMVGFSCHDGRLTDYLMAAAEGGFVDIIMLAYRAFYTKGDAFDRALDACHAKGIALVAMKTMRNTKELPVRLPEFDKLGLTVHQAVLHAVWSDPRISSICNQLDNVGQIETNTAAARSYKKPLPLAHRELLKQTVLAGGRHTFCPGCPSCDSFAATSAFAFRDISRYVTYYEQDGELTSRERYRALPAFARDTSGVDLTALRDQCAFHVDYPAVMQRAGRYFA
jgi:uncharacterized protein